MQEWLKKLEQYSHVLLFNEIRDTEPEDYKNYFRMNDITFDKLQNSLKHLPQPRAAICAYVGILNT